MPIDTYVTVAGFIQFEPNVRDQNGKTLQDVLIQNISGNKDIRVTVWPELGLEGLERGDFLIAAGKYTEKDSGTPGKPYRNVSANKALVFKGTAVAAPRVVNPIEVTETPEPDTDDSPF